MIVRALFWVVAAFLGVVLPCGEAWAQTLTVVTQGAIIGRRADRDNGLDTKTINYADCVAGDALDVTYNVMGPNVPMEVWVGSNTDCSVAATRMTTANVPALCWKIASVAAVTSSHIPLKVWDILPRNSTEPGTESVCEELANGTGTVSTGNGNLTVYFVPVDGNMNSGTGFPIAVKFDLQGPAPPSDLDTLLGDTRLYPTWTLDAAAANDSNGYNLYCEPASGSCASDALTAGEIPPAEASVRGTTGASSTSGEASGLTNYVNYACGVAGIDKLSNVGKLSELVCATPEPVNGYFKQYRAAGGTAGGGYCSFARRAETPAGAATSLAAVALLFLRRRGRRTAA